MVANWPKIPNHSYKLLIIMASGFGKSNSLYNLINHQKYIDKVYFYPKDLYEAKYQLLIDKQESTGLN